jgi:hypothetical protein
LPVKKQGDLGRCRALPVRGLLQQVDQSQVGSARPRGEAGERGPEVLGVERRRGVDLPGEKSLAERAPRNEADAHLFAERRERRADVLLVRERTVRLGGVEEGDAALDGGADDRNCFGAVGRRPIAVVQPHAAVADLGDLKGSKLPPCRHFTSRRPG